MDTDSLFGKFYGIITKLRSPGGCPWDMKQTAETLKGNLLEETYEALEAVSSGDDENLKEELGDVLLVAAMIVRIKEEEGSFSMADVLDAVNEKLIRRHPHVFSDVKVKDADEVLKNWDNIKISKEGKKKKRGLETISKKFPALERAFLIQKKAAEAGFDWDNIEDVIKKLEEEVEELKEALSEKSCSCEREKELGDILFSAVNAARFLKSDPSAALHLSNEKFIKRFSYVEDEMKKLGKPLVKENFALMDELWEKAKLLER